MTDVRDMAIIHRTFRRTYEESAALVRANPAPSEARVTFLADHIAFGLMMLHHHHEAEEAHLFPLLHQRRPEEAAAVGNAEEQHQAIAAALSQAEAANAAWRAEAGAATGENLAAALDHLNAVLIPHLDDEEETIVPLAANTLTQAEWDTIGETAIATIPRSRLPMAFGLVLEPLGPEDTAHMKSHLPAPVRLLFPLLIARPWAKYAHTLRHGV